ncbi:MAG: hypothetical protein GMKNLPBB_00951 [Myxococcota bacterium]|nr:hypothetical protein [Myxococcota bacterium]
MTEGWRKGLAVGSLLATFAALTIAAVHHIRSSLAWDEYRYLQIQAASQAPAAPQTLVPAVSPAQAAVPAAAGGRAPRRSSVIPAADPVFQPGGYDGKVYATMRGKTFHRPSCPVLHGADESRLREFPSPRNAMVFQLEPCERCHPEP